MSWCMAGGYSCLASGKCSVNAFVVHMIGKTVLGDVAAHSVCRRHMPALPKSWEHSRTDRNPPGASLPIPPSVGQRCGRPNASMCCGCERGRNSSEEGTAGSQRSCVSLALRPGWGWRRQRLGRPDQAEARRKCPGRTSGHQPHTPSFPDPSRLPS